MKQSRAIKRYLVDEAIKGNQGQSEAITWWMKRSAKRLEKSNQKQSEAITWWMKRSAKRFEKSMTASSHCGNWKRVAPQK